MNLHQQLLNYVLRVNDTLEQWLPAADGGGPGDLYAAMRYAVLGNGKRIRPLLTYAAGEALQIEPDCLDGPACAVELIHAYSLVHDDLPAMDDDDLRRGRPTTHRAFSESTAILVGDSLQALAFQILAVDPKMGGDPITHAATVATLSQACGPYGMSGGQAMDIASEGKSLTLEELERMHFYKTGQLLRASVLMAYDCDPQASPQQREALDSFATRIGLAFQIRDDILDIEGQTEVIGKPQGSDHAQNKATYPALLGMAEAKRRAEQLHEDAIKALSGFGSRAGYLRELGDYIVQRDH